MKIKSMKRYLPKKLFGRTILIFLFPIIMIELVVFVAFIQRHFEQVTSQMSEVFSYQVKYIINSVADETKENKQALVNKIGKDFELEVEIIPAEPLLKIKHLEIFDFSGGAFVKTMRKNFGESVFFDFSESRKITLVVLVEDQFLSVTIPRGRISAANPHQLLVLMVFVSILVVFLAIIILRNQLKPIIKLAEVSEAFGKGQSLYFKPAGSEEVRRAGLAFIAMRSRIEKQIEQRTQMLSGVSHDLRTPLTRLKLGLTLLKNEDDAKEMLEDVDSMRAMLDEFLIFAKTEAIEEPTNLDVVRLVERIVTRNKKQLQNIKFTTESNIYNSVVIPLREIMFERAIQNIIENARNVSSKISIHLDIKKSFLQILIEDNGPGIDPEDREKALKPFTRLDQSRNQNNHSGVGLGLSIALDTVRSHGGNLILESSTLLGGLKVKITLPL